MVKLCPLAQCLLVLGLEQQHLETPEDVKPVSDDLGSRNNRAQGRTIQQLLELLKSPLWQIKHFLKDTTNG